MTVVHSKRADGPVVPIYRPARSPEGFPPFPVPAPLRGGLPRGFSDLRIRCTRSRLAIFARLSPGSGLSCPLKVRETSYVANAAATCLCLSRTLRDRETASYIMRNARDKSKRNVRKREEETERGGIGARRRRVTTRAGAPPPPPPPLRLIVIDAFLAARAARDYAFTVRNMFLRIRAAVSLKRDLCLCRQCLASFWSFARTTRSTS